MTSKCKVKCGYGVVQKELCQKERNGYICNRELKHKGQHHAHAGDDCFLKWK